MKQNRMYDEFAYLWPLISPPEDYAEEAKHWREILRAKLGPGRHEILELGVGGGHNLSHLTADFQATAVDLSEKMLEHSKRLNPGVEHHVGDMRTFRLGRKFKAVLIHDAISYMLSHDDLYAAFQTAAAHLEPDGVLVTGPDWFKETYQDGNVSHTTRLNDRTQLTYIEYGYDPNPNDTTVECIMFYLIREQGQLRVEQDRHITGIFPKQTWIDLLTQAGFDVEIRELELGSDPRQYCLFVATLADANGIVY